MGCTELAAKFWTKYILVGVRRSLKEEGILRREGSRPLETALEKPESGQSCGYSINFLPDVGASESGSGQSVAACGEEWEEAVIRLGM